MTMLRRPGAYAPALVLLALASAACNTDVTEPEGPTWAYAELQAVESPTTRVVSTRPFAAFFRAANVRFPDSRTVVDQCVASSSGANAPDPNIPAAFRYMEAGPSVTLTLGTATRTLERTTQTRSDGTLLFYNQPTADGGFTPDANFTITTPGAQGGFPAATLSGRTTVPFTFQPVADAGPSTQVLPLRWTAAPTGHQSAMLVELRYTGVVSGVPTPRAIFCSLVDDGSHDVPANLAAEWYAASAATHETIFQRLRTTIQQASGYASVIASTYTTTKATTPTAQ